MPTLNLQTQNLNIRCDFMLKHIFDRLSTHKMGLLAIVYILEPFCVFPVLSGVKHPTPLPRVREGRSATLEDSGTCRPLTKLLTNSAPTNSALPTRPLKTFFHLEDSSTVFKHKMFCLFFIRPCPQNMP